MPFQRQIIEESLEFPPDILTSKVIAMIQGTKHATRLLFKRVQKGYTTHSFGPISKNLISV